MMKILVIGSGGREHALCWKLARCAPSASIFCAPGNPGITQCGTNTPIDAMDIDTLASFARQEQIDLTVVGPEAPLCAGIRQRFNAEGLLLVGPSAEAARLEGSKAFAKDFMSRHEIPTTPAGVFEDAPSAAAYIDTNPNALVVKADGLAGGKGVFVCQEPAEAKTVIKRLLDGALGKAGKRVVVESKLAGEEASFIVLSDGERAYPFASSQDHKAVFDGDRGPNTGGMGAYSPAPVLEPELQRRVMADVVEPTIVGMANEGRPYQGFLYVGLMVHDSNYSVLEFNCRLGDPETQPLMARLDGDLVGLLMGAAQGKLPVDTDLSWDTRAALCVVMATEGYPGSYRKGMPILGLDEAGAMDDVVIFHAGTAQTEMGIITAGGRVLGVTALGEGVAAAQRRAYEAVACLSWEGSHFRRDIGFRALRKSSKQLAR